MADSPLDRIKKNKQETGHIITDPYVSDIDPTITEPVGVAVQQPPKPKKQKSENKSFIVRLSPRNISFVKHLAYMYGSSLSAVVGELLDKEFEKLPETEKQAVLQNSKKK